MHEIGHAYMAYIRGDDTAKQMGRITLNPIPHIDLFGSIIFPIILLLSKTPILFAWAKPVPINYSKLKNPKYDVPLVAFAGPFVHIILIFASIVFIKCSIVFQQWTFGLGNSIIEFCYIMISINAILMIFNLMPIPPLDGSKVISCILPDRIAYKYMSLNPYIGFLIIMLLILTGILGTILSNFMGFINLIIVKVIA
jgi:Zn-dependent protease